MKRLLFILCLTVCILGSVTAVSATPIAQDQSVTWCFDTQSLNQGDTYTTMQFQNSFSVDLFDLGEIGEWIWTDEINSTPLYSFQYTSPGGIWSDGFSIQHTFSPGWTANEDIYMTLKMIQGSVNVQPNPVFQWATNSSTGAQESLNATGTSVPDASVMLLLGSSLMGLALFSRKSKRS